MRNKSSLLSVGPGLTIINDILHSVNYTNFMQIVLLVESECRLGQHSNFSSINLEFCTGEAFGIDIFGYQNRIANAAIAYEHAQNLNMSFSGRFPIIDLMNVDLSSYRFSRIKCPKILRKI